LTDGSAIIDELFKYGGREAAQNYIIAEVSKLYELQGEAVSRKHIEVIVRQMFSRRKVKDAGMTALSAGDVVEYHIIANENARLKEIGGEEAKADEVVMGITDVSLSRKSFLSAASFQHTTRVLINSAVRGSKDKLVGLMENVIIGRLIPAGTGFKGSPKNTLIQEKASNQLNQENEE
jgi:DNA-directed RNA polymerase subunit beta'